MFSVCGIWAYYIVSGGEQSGWGKPLFMAREPDSIPHDLRPLPNSRDRQRLGDVTGRCPSGKTGLAGPAGQSSADLRSPDKIGSAEIPS